jgi:hypothetical protein
MAAASRTPTEQDRVEAITRLLDGLAQGIDAHELAASIWDLHPRYNTFPGEVFLEVAVAALERSGPNPTPLDYNELLTGFLPECEFKGRDNEKIRFAILAAAANRGGIAPDLLDVTSWWGSDDNPYWRYSLFAATAIVRACAQRCGTTVEAFVRGLRPTFGDQERSPR